MITALIPWGYYREKWNSVCKYPSRYPSCSLQSTNTSSLLDKYFWDKCWDSPAPCLCLYARDANTSQSISPLTILLGKITWLKPFDWKLPEDRGCLVPVVTSGLAECCHMIHVCKCLNNDHHHPCGRLYASTEVRAYIWWITSSWGQSCVLGTSNPILQMSALRLRNNLSKVTELELGEVSFESRSVGLENFFTYAMLRDPKWTSFDPTYVSL